MSIFDSPLLTSHFFLVILHLVGELLAVQAEEMKKKERNRENLYREKGSPD